MTNAEALTSFIEWWKGVPDSKRPGERGHFSMTDSAVEEYVRGLRDIWNRCGNGILRICDGHRDALEREAVQVVDDVLAWLDRIDAKLRTQPGDADGIKNWLEKWRRKLSDVRSAPLRDAPGLTLGVGPNSTLLRSFRWWGDLAGMPTGAGGPLSDAPKLVHEQALGLPFPDSVNDLQYAFAKSPWTAAYVLNWLLSSKGILPESRKAPAFDGPLAVPDARMWLDQMEFVFSDWRAAKFENRKVPRLKLDAGKLTETAPMSNPQFDAAISQLMNPVLPSTYVVASGEETLDLKHHASGNPTFLKSREGQCCIFEFLCSRVALLEGKASNFGTQPNVIPELTIVDGKRKGTFAVQVGLNGMPRKLSRGAAMLLLALNRDGIVKSKVLWKVVDEVKRVISEVEVYVTSSKKNGNKVSEVSGESLRGQIVWKSTNRQRPL